MLLTGTALFILSLLKIFSATSYASPVAPGFVSASVNNSNLASSHWKLISTPATAPYCQIMPETGCVKMGFGKQGLCEIVALRTMLVKTIPAQGVNLVTINGHVSEKSHVGVLALNQNDKVACRACVDCNMNVVSVEMCVMGPTMTSDTLPRPSSSADCSDLETNWTDAEGRSCAHFAAQPWCNSSPDSSLRPSDYNVDARRVCCACGGGKRSDRDTVIFAKKSSSIGLIVAVAIFGVLAFLLCPAAFVIICCCFFRRMQADQELDEQRREEEVASLRREFTLVHDILQANQAAEEKKKQKQKQKQKQTVAVVSVPAVTTTPSAAQASTQSNLMQRRQQRREQRRRRQQQHTHEDKENMPELATNILPGPATNAPPELSSDNLPEHATNLMPAPAKDILPATNVLPGPGTNVPSVPTKDISIIVNDSVSTNFNKVAVPESGAPDKAAPRGEISANGNNKGSTSAESAPPTKAKSTPRKKPVNSTMTQQKAPPAQETADAGTSNEVAAVVSKKPTKKIIKSRQKGALAKKSQNFPKKIAIKSSKKAKTTPRRSASSIERGSSIISDSAKSGLLKRLAAANDRHYDDTKKMESKKRMLKKFLLSHGQFDLADQVSQILRRHRGRERELFARLEVKFGGSLSGDFYVHEDTFSVPTRQLEY